VHDADGAVALASAYVDAHNHARAEQVLRDALTASPDSAVLLANLARVQVLMRDFDSATRTAYAALGISPEDAFAMRIYTIALDGAGQLEQALWMAWRTASTHPHDRLAHFVYAELLLKAQRPHDALFVVGEALRLDPVNPETHVLRGQVLSRLGRIDESTAAYEEALRLDPGNASAVHNIGVNRLARSKWSAALAGFLGAARLDPDLGDLARRNIGIALTRLLRLTTVVVVLLACLIFWEAPSLEQGARPSTGHQILVGLCTAVLLGYLGWLSRAVPLRTWRSVLRIKPALVLRLGLVVCAVPIGALVAVGRGEKVAAVAAAILVLAALVVSLAGRFTDS
jgi:Flp pilus assembly protein TadD